MLVDSSDGAATPGARSTDGRASCASAHPLRDDLDCTNLGCTDMDLYDVVYGDPSLFEDSPVPSWALAAHAASLREDLTEATSAPVDRDALALLMSLDPQALADTARRADTGGRRGVDARQAARTLLDGIVVAQRVINHAHAVQQRLIAAFCRPGVAIPLADLMDMAGDDLSDALAAAVDSAVDSASAPAAAENVVTGGGRNTSSLLSHPVWAQVLRGAAVKTSASEIGCALHLAPVTARMRCAQATDLVDHLPATTAGQLRGDIDPFRARLLAEKLEVLPENLRHQVELQVLPFASTRTTAAFKRLIDREVTAADPAAAERRLERAKKGRGVYTSRGEDGAGVFTAIVSAADAELASRTLDAIAASLASDGLAQGRTRTQLRADAFCDLFRTLADTGHVAIAPPRRHSRGGECNGGEPGGSAAITPSWCCSALPTGHASSIVSVRRAVALNVYLNASTLAGLDNAPAELEGVGAITAETARALAASADTIRAIITRPAAPGRTCDTILDAGRSVYRPPDKTADYVAARDRTCAFPGCRTRASRCDLDHRHPFDSGGETCPCNLDALCRSHHRLKTFTGWAAKPDPTTGRLSWTSPLGNHYPIEQGHLLYDRLAPESGRAAPLPDHPAPATALSATSHGADDPPPF